MVATVLGLPAPAAAQLSRLSGSIAALYPGGTMRGSDVGYDERNDVYLLVVGNGPIFGIFVNSAGNPVTGGFPIMSGQGWGHFPRRSTALMREASSSPGTPTAAAPTLSSAGWSTSPVARRPG